jgi:hypothetical protein
MRNIPGRRGIAAIGAVAALLLGTSGSAEALEESLYSNDGPVDVRLIGGDVLALKACVRDASDGVISYAFAECDRVTTPLAVMGFLLLRDVVVYVYPSGSHRYVYHGSGVDVRPTGAAVMTISWCLNDTLDGVVDFAIGACRSLAAQPPYGLALTGVGVTVTR